jgi:hypothetical protein
MTSPAVAIALADLDGDGDLDVVVARNGPLVVAPAGVFLGNGNGTLGAMTTFGAGGSARAVAVGQIDSDPWKELVFGGTTGVRVLKGLTGGAFGTQTSYLGGISIDAVDIADVDANARREVLAVSAARNSISVLAFDLAGAFLQKSEYGTGRDPRALAMADFNGDGWLDLATADFGDTTVTVIRNRTGATTAVDPAPTALPRTALLLAPRPNPSFGASEIRWVVPSACKLDLAIFDLAGRRMRLLLAGATSEPGQHSVTWDGRDDRGARAREGMYLVHLRAAGIDDTRKLFLLRRD